MTCAQSKEHGLQARRSVCRTYRYRRSSVSALDDSSRFFTSNFSSRSNEHFLNDVDLYKNKFRIACVSSSEEICDLVYKSAANYPCDIYVHISQSENIKKDIIKLLNSGIETVIYHGDMILFDNDMLLNNVAILERMYIDIIKTLLEVKKTTDKIVFTSSIYEIHDINLLNFILNLNIRFIRYKSMKELKEGLHEAYCDGFHTAVGGYETKIHMDKLGGTGISIMPNQNVIHTTIKRAISLAKNRRFELSILEELLSVLSHIDYGIILVSSDNNILYYSKYALQILSITSKNPEISMRRYFSNFCITKVLKTGIPFYDLVINIDNKQIIADTFPIFTYGQKKGAVTIFRDINTLQNIKTKISSALKNCNFTAKYTCADIRGESKAIRNVIYKIKNYAQTDANIHIVGETGTGKELVAHSIHNASPRRDKPFIAINCTSLAPPLLESELFGYEEGAFTGARRGGKPGLFELANGGTLFLDEITDISPELQAKLLRIIEAKEFMRVGGGKILSVDVRIISASQKALGNAVNNGGFRMDLYYRLATLQITLPALRDRLEDLPVLVNAALEKFHAPHSCLSPACMKLLKNYSYPGNIRELFAILESYCTLCPDGRPDETLFREIFEERTGYLSAHAEDSSGDSAPTFRQMGKAERMKAILQAVEHAGGNKRKAAETLGISYNTLWRHMKE